MIDLVENAVVATIDVGAERNGVSFSALEPATPPSSTITVDDGGPGEMGEGMGN